MFHPTKIPVETRDLPVYTISDAAGLSPGVIYNLTKYVNAFLAKTNKSCFWLLLTFLLEQSQEQISENPGGQKKTHETPIFMIQNSTKNCPVIV